MDNKEPSRVVHLRLKNSTILGCHKLTEIQQGATEIPISTMLSDVLDSLINKLVSSGKLPLVEDHTAGVVLNSIYRIQVDDEGDIAMDEIPEPDMFESFMDTVEVEEGDIQDNLAIHELPLDKEFQKRSSDEQQGEVEKIDYPFKPPWETRTIGDKTFTEIERIAPKDILVEAAEGNEHLQRAAEIVYSSLPLDMWGSTKAQSLIAEVMPLVIHYLGPLPTEQVEEDTNADTSTT